MAARRLLTRGPNPLEPPEAQPQTVPVGKRTALKVQEKVAPRRAGIRATCRSCSAAARAKSEGGELVRYYLGVDWADQTHAVWVVDERGTKITARTVPHTAEGLSEWGRELDEWRAHGIELWAAIERPEGRVVDFLLDHGIVVYPVNPKALDRARDRFRQSGAKDDPFDARVLADFLRTDHAHLHALQPSSEAAQELKLLTEDYHRQVRQQTRLVNQLTITLKAYYPRALEVAESTTALAREFLKAYPTPEAVTALTKRQWQRWARAHHLSETRTRALWEVLQQPQLPVPAHVVRPKARLMRTLVAELAAVVAAVGEYREAIEDFFASMPTAQWVRTLPIGDHGITAPTLWARLGDAPERWESFRHLQAQAGAVPLTKRSGKQRVVQFRFACGTWSIMSRSSRSVRVNGPGRTTTSSGRGDIRIARRSGRWAQSG